MKDLSKSSVLHPKLGIYALMNSQEIVATQQIIFRAHLEP